VSLEQRINRAWLSRGLGMRLLWPLSRLMAGVVAWRRMAFLRGWTHSARLPVPVIVVGNRVVGGAGKTPTTLALLAHLKATGWHPGVLSRGYKAALPKDGPLLLDAQTHAGLSARQTGDEPMLIWRRAHVPVMIGRDRGASGQALLARHPEIDVLVCDDGLQHLALQRDIEVVVFDERGAGNGWLLPAGPLREPVDTPPCAMPIDGARPPALVLYNAAQPSTHLPGHLAYKQLHAPVPFQDWWQGQPASARLQPHQAVWAAAGIAQPQRFFDALAATGLAVTGLPLDDHADWSTLPWPVEATDVVLTEKDAVKLSPERLAQERPDTRVWVSALDFDLEATFWEALDARLPQRPGNTVRL